jgi:hypothetical protein
MRRVPRMQQNVSKHIKYTINCTLLIGILDKAPEATPEVLYHPSANEEAGDRVTACSDSPTQPGDLDLGHTSTKTGKPDVSAACSMSQHCIPEPAQGKPTDSSKEASSKVESSQSAIDFAKSAAKLTLKTIKEVSDVFPPLKSVAAGLSLIVENAEVRDYLVLLFILTTHVTAHVVSEREPKRRGKLVYANETDTGYVEREGDR